MGAKLQERPFNRKEVLLAVEDALLISLNTIHPPDRCGVIRRLCLQDTLKLQADGLYCIDVTQLNQPLLRACNDPDQLIDQARVGQVAGVDSIVTQSGFEFNEYGEDEEATRTRRRYVFSQRRDTTQGALIVHPSDTGSLHRPYTGPTPTLTFLRAMYITLDAP